ncbi:hypothetical protein AB4Y32_12635 [Paraburkholderia phymatum]|uniref:Uncharacterized protein n=1 Tax=Paraburkholderia phymatum TaxID=148447 RepID=A0ACC6TYU8_9BURK
MVATLFVVFDAFAPASAMRFALPCAGIRVCAFAARALPLCGAALTFFAAAKKVSKESGLTPPVLDDYPRALNVPEFHTAVCWLAFVANALAKRLTRFMHA